MSFLGLEITVLQFPIISRFSMTVSKQIQLLQYYLKHSVSSNANKEALRERVDHGVIMKAEASLTAHG